MIMMIIITDNKSIIVVRSCIVVALMMIMSMKMLTGFDINRNGDKDTVTVQKLR